MDAQVWSRNHLKTAVLIWPVWCVIEICFQMISLDTSALLRSSVFKKHPRQKVIAPPRVASQESSHKLWASFTLFSKGNFILAHTMMTAEKSKNWRRFCQEEVSKNVTEIQNPRVNLLVLRSMNCAQTIQPFVLSRVVNPIQGVSLSFDVVIPPPGEVLKIVQIPTQKKEPMLGRETE